MLQVWPQKKAKEIMFHMHHFFGHVSFLCTLQSNLHTVQCIGTRDYSAPLEWLFPWTQVISSLLVLISVQLRIRGKPSATLSMSVSAAVSCLVLCHMYTSASPSTDSCFHLLNVGRLILHPDLYQIFQQNSQ